MKKIYPLALILIMFSQFTWNEDTKQIIWRYPKIESDTTQEVYFEQIVKDPYRSLENSNKTINDHWIKEENKLYSNVFQNITNRDSLEKEIQNFYTTSNIWTDIPRMVKSKTFFRHFYYKEGIQKLTYRDGINKNEIDLFSTETINKKGINFRIDYFEPSLEGDYVAFGVSINGSEQSILHILDVAKQELLTEKIERTMNGTPNWVPDGSGFFYTQYKELLTKEDSMSRYEGSKIRFHKIGDPVNIDRDIFSRAMYPNLQIDKTDFIHLYTFPSSNKVILAAMKGKQSCLFSASLDQLLDVKTEKATWNNVCLPNELVQSFALNGDVIFLLRNMGKEYGILEKREINDLSKNQILLDGNEKGLVLQDMIQTQNAIYVKSYGNGYNHLSQIDLSNFNIKEVKLPINGSLSINPSFAITPVYSHSSNLFLSLSSWNQDRSIYNYDHISGELIKTTLQEQGAYTNLSNILFKRVEALSYDGAKVPMTLIYDRRMKRNRKNITILHAYGAFGTFAAPNFDKSLLAWINRGGIYAIAHVRGGGEKGETWHKGGYKETKANSWKDFIACAEYLIKNKYTSSNRLGAHAASAGGITIGRAITERPSLFKAVVISAGFLNTIRIERIFNKANVNEFGSTEDSIEFKHLLNMDVYYHIKENTDYPALLFTAGINDARLPLWQTTKAVAKFQAFSNGTKPILLRVKNGGHFDDTRDISNKYTFFLWQLGHTDFQYKPNDKD